MYKEKTPTNDLFIHIYRVAGILKDAGFTPSNYTKKGAKEALKNMNLAVPGFCTKLVDRYSNEIIKNL